MRLVDYARQKVEERLVHITDWEKLSDRMYPEPNLIENKIYPVKGMDGDRFYARFCFGGGEYWWLSAITNREVRVAEFSRNGFK